MPHTRSAKKNLRKTEKRRLRNRTDLRTLKTHLKKVGTTAAEGNVEALRTEVKTTMMRLDKAAAKHVIHRNKAARLKSRIARLLSQKEKAPAAPQ